MTTECTITEEIPGIEEYEALRVSVGWGGMNLESLAGGLRGCLLCVCMRKDGRLIGFGRVLGDGCSAFYIQDVIVHPDHQKKGLGKAIMDRLIGWINSVCAQDTFVGLEAAPGVIGFYEQLGFSVRPPDAPGMELWLKQHRTQLGRQM
jgi:GNAT superfamily N-acetyltransferase